MVIVGTLGMALSIALFGLAKSYWMMIAMRCIGGTMGGTMTCASGSYFFLGGLLTPE